MEQMWPKKKKNCDSEISGNHFPGKSSSELRVMSGGVKVSVCSYSSFALSSRDYSIPSSSLCVDRKILRPGSSGRLRCKLYGKRITEPVLAVIESRVCKTRYNLYRLILKTGLLGLRRKFTRLTRCLH